MANLKERLILNLNLDEASNVMLTRLVRRACNNGQFRDDLTHTWCSKWALVCTCRYFWKKSYGVVVGVGLVDCCTIFL